MIKNNKLLKENMEYRTPKGTRDFLPKEKILRNELVSSLKNVFERYGFNPLETPALEKYETCTAKFSAGEETDVLEELFSFEDRGGRELGLRYELTFPFARVFANNPQLPKPFKRYQVGRAWRNGPIKKGRYREFWQADADIVGIEDMIADAEVLALGKDVFEELDLDVVIKLNNRKLLDGILEYCGVPEGLRTKATISIDKLDKIGREGVKDELIDRGLDKESSENILDLIEIEDLDELRERIEGYGEEGFEELEELFEKLQTFGVTNYEFSPSLARGLVYYTGTIFEVFLKDSEISSSVAAGGRWDNLISKFGNFDEKVPAVGISFGLHTLFDAIGGAEEDSRRSVADALIISIKERKKAIEIMQTLREKKVKTDMDLKERGISKSLEYANSLGIPKVVIVGPKDLKENKVTVKYMKSGKEDKVKVSKIGEELREK